MKTENNKRLKAVDRLGRKFSKTEMFIRKIFKEIKLEYGYKKQNELNDDNN